MFQPESLFLLNNQITELPESIADLPSLEHLRIIDNPIIKLPEDLFSKPNRLTDLHIYRTPLENDEQPKGKIRKLKEKNNWIKREKYLIEKEKKSH